MFTNENLYRIRNKADDLGISISDGKIMDIANDFGKKLAPYSDICRALREAEQDGYDYDPDYEIPGDREEE